MRVILSRRPHSKNLLFKAGFFSPAVYEDEHLRRRFEPSVARPRCFGNGPQGKHRRCASSSLADHIRKTCFLKQVFFRLQIAFASFLLEIAPLLKYIYPSSLMNSLSLFILSSYFYI
jgi:hypothetical protein